MGETAEFHIRQPAEMFTRYGYPVEDIIHKMEFEDSIIGWPEWKKKLYSWLIEKDERVSELRLPAVTDEKGNTRLHQAVTLAGLLGESYGDFYRYIDLFMNEEAEVNKPNKKGYTAIGIAVYHRYMTCVEHMLKHPSARRLYLDYYPGDSESTVREIIMQTYPDLQPPVPAPLMESLEAPERNMKLLVALQHDQYDTFRENLQLTKPNPWYAEPYNSTLLEIACQMKGRKRFVELLLDSRANPNIKNHVTGMPLLLATARSKNLEALEILLKTERTKKGVKDREGRAILHWLAGVSESSPGDEHKIECFLNFLLRSDYIRNGINDRDSSGNTALCIAVERGFKNRAELLLSKGADVRALEYGREILSASLPILEEILDDCVMSNGEPVKSRDFLLWLKCRLLLNIVFRMADSQRLRDLLRHPVISTFLGLLWQKLRLWIFLVFAYYSTSVFSLTAYILYSECYNTRNEEDFSFKDSRITSSMNDSDPIPQTNATILGIFWCILTICLIFRTLFLLLCLTLLRIYPKDLLLYFHLILLIVAIFISCYDVVDIIEMKRHFSALALLLGWLELFFILGQWPQLSLHLQMLKTFIWTFLTFMAGYCLLLTAFALSFYILFKGSRELDGTPLFSNPLESLMKTIVMFSGEFVASNLKFNNLPSTSHVVFSLFVVLIAIVLLNLLNGLAVSDTDAIRKNAETLSLVKRVKILSQIFSFIGSLRIFITRMEIEEISSFVPNICSEKCIKELCTFYPNRPNSIGPTQIRSLLSINNKKRQPKKKRELSEGE